MACRNRREFETQRIDRARARGSSGEARADIEGKRPAQRSRTLPRKRAS